MATTLTTARRVKSTLLLALFATAIASVPTDCAQADEPTTIPLVMVVIGFDGGDDPDAAAPYSDAYDWHDALFGADESPSSYYLDMSNGRFTFAPAAETSAFDVAENANAADLPNDGIVHVVLHRPHGSWGAVNVDPSVTRDFAATVVEALDAAGAFVDFASFDSDGDGCLAASELGVCLCVAGYEAAAVADFNREDIPLLWSHSGLLSVIDEAHCDAGGIRFDSYIAIAEQYWDESDSLETAEQEPLGVVYHELGHALGLPDLYAVTVTEGPWEGYEVGPLSLMDGGGWRYADDGNGWRNIPTSLDAWSRCVLGWTQPVIAARTGDYAVSGQLSEAGYRCLAIPTADPSEYFLVEYRPSEGHDVSLANDDAIDGLIVWHVDNGMFERFYDANTMNDADHRPAVMGEAVTADAPAGLMLYDDSDDVPEAQAASGITVQAVSTAERDAVVHVETDDEAAARNALHLLKDPARAKLAQHEPELLQQVASVIKASV